jgi:lipopolysaccharide biosynthesis regulator YciM
MFDSYLAWLLLPLGVVLGWAWARNSAGAGSGGREETLAGLTSLDPDNADLAIAALSRAAEAQPAAELQLTLGALFRKRGEIDRAIQLHEAVLAHPGQPARIADAARIELAQDYLKAGLLDRAEALLQGMDGASPQLAAALELLLDLYEQARDWPQALETARQLQTVKGQSTAARMAQYRCELAEAALQRGAVEEAAGELEGALTNNPECVRASLAQAAMAEKSKQWDAAIKAYWRAMQQDGRFFPEVVPAIERCYTAAADPQGYARFLDEAEAALTTSAAPALNKARWMQSQGQDLRDYLGEHLARIPTRQGMLLWLEGGDADDAPPWLLTMRESLKKSLQGRPRYACTACGLQPSMLFWQCPKCKRWETVVPQEERL